MLQSSRLEEHEWISSVFEMCNTQETEYQFLGHIYTPSFDTVDHYLPLLPVELPKTTQLPPVGK